MGPFPTPPFENFRFYRLALSPKNIPTNSEQYSIYPSQSLGSLSSIILLKRMISLCNILLLTMPLQQFRNLAQAATWAKQTLNLLFGSFRSIRKTGHSWGCFEMGSIILTKCSHLGFALPRTFSISCQMPLSGFYLTNVPSPLFATFWMISLSGATLSYPSIRFPLSGKPVEYDLDLQKFKYPYLRSQNRGAFPNYSVHGYHTRFWENGGKATRG